MFDNFIIRFCALVIQKTGVCSCTSAFASHTAIIKVQTITMFLIGACTIYLLLTIYDMQCATEKK